MRDRTKISARVVPRYFLVSASESFLPLYSSSISHHSLRSAMLAVPSTPRMESASTRLRLRR